MGLEPMTSPLPRECSTTELHQHFKSTLSSYRERAYPITTRKAKNQSRTQVSDRNFPGSMVCHVNTPSTANAASAISKRPRPAGLRSTTTPVQPTAKNGAQGRIRTSVARCAADLQSAAINHSATCASSASPSSKRSAQPSPPDPGADSDANRTGKYLEGVV